MDRSPRALRGSTVSHIHPHCAPIYHPTLRQGLVIVHHVALENDHHLFALYARIQRPRQQLCCLRTPQPAAMRSVAPHGCRCGSGGAGRWLDVPCTCCLRSRSPCPLQCPQSVTGPAHPHARRCAPGPRVAARCRASRSPSRRVAARSRPSDPRSCDCDDARHVHAGQRQMARRLTAMASWRERPSWGSFVALTFSGC
jgi:hypothetical protein